MRVNVVCQNLHEDRVIPRFARYLAQVNGWQVTSKPVAGADAYYLSGYFEGLRGVPEGAPVGAYFTHLETAAESQNKADLWWSMAQRIDLRVVTAGQYGRILEPYGATVQILPPVERERFVIPRTRGRRGRLVAGFSGFVYGNGRKGEGLAKRLMGTEAARGVDWLASGRGWPVRTQNYSWAQMPGFYQSLDVLVLTATVEGVPMPALEALSCGVSLVAPRGVGLLDELGEVVGVYRYDVGDELGLAAALEMATAERGDVQRKELRALTEPFTVEGWARGHREAFEMLGGKGEERREKREERGAEGRGIMCVAFGEPARVCARRLIDSAKRIIPDVPICLIAAAPLGGEDVFVARPDADIGARVAKLELTESIPEGWETILYLDADIEVVSRDILYLFECIEAGWEFVICGDLRGKDSMHWFERPDNGEEMAHLRATLPSMSVLQYNGGVWAFGRGGRGEELVQRWRAEWERFGGRDQGALVRALHSGPVRLLTLGAEWNTFARYGSKVEAAAVVHHTATARRWSGIIRGRLDSAEAWKRVVSG